MAVPPSELTSSQWTWKDRVVAKSGAVCLFMGIFEASGPPVAISGIGRKMPLNTTPFRNYWYITNTMANTIKTIIMHLPCQHVSSEGNFGGVCPECLCSTEEEFDVTKCISTIKTQKCAQQVCSKLPKTFFWPCQHNFFCQSCAETHFECAKTGRERCLCGEIIEGIYTMDTTDLDNEETPRHSAL